MTDAIQISENMKYCLKFEKILNDFLQIFENVSNFQEMLQVVRVFGRRMVKCWVFFSLLPAHPPVHCKMSKIFGIMNTENEKRK